MKKMIAILLVLCLLPVTGLAMVFLQKVSDINAFSGNRLNYIETTPVILSQHINTLAKA